ncbi:DUF7282 domain-containing protein [Halorussus salinisoli]|uniref:DUF7282 domain-containing protein n=1 Tax=Halorussus salinisoli TaxID=2558242 RepID=UPI0014855766|nr:BGTF surface domain-containing protein [Halorussus salinisoli]
MSAALPKRLLVSCLVALLLVSSGVTTAAVTAPADSTADASPPSASHSDTTATPSPPVSFHSSILTDQRGDVVELGIHFSDAENATVRVGSSATHVATVVVRDADGDDDATLQFDTYDGSLAAGEGDALAVREQSNATTPLATGTYELDLWAENDTAGERWDVAKLLLENRTTGGLRSYVPSAETDLSEPNDVPKAAGTGDLVRSRVVTLNDTFVLELRASGLDGAIAAQNGTNATDRFFRFLDGDGANLRIEQIDPGTSFEAALMHPAPDSTDLVADARNDTYYLVVDLAEVNVTRGWDDRLAAGQHYRANLTLSRASVLADARESATTEFEVHEPEADLVTTDRLGEREFDLDVTPSRARVEAAPNQTVAVETSVPPGSELTVVVEGEGDTFQFEATGRVRNASEGFVYAPEFDFSDVPPGTNFTVTVRHRGEAIMGYGGPDPGVVVEPTPTVWLESANATAANASADLPFGGFVVVHRNATNGQIIGTSGYLAPDESARASVAFDSALESNATLVAVTYRDTDGDGAFDPETDEPYTDGEDDHRVAASASVTVEEIRETTATTRETTESTSSSPASPGIELPGFCAGTALVALLACLALARRR